LKYEFPNITPETLSAARQRMLLKKK